MTRAGCFEASCNLHLDYRLLRFCLLLLYHNKVLSQCFAIYVGSFRIIGFTDVSRLLL